jgi:hypothetical protein
VVDADDLELHTQLLGALPLISHFLDRLGLAQLLDAYLPYDDPRLALALALAIGVVVRNLIAHREPLDALGEWASAFDPTVVGLTSAEVACLNDDRVGRTLDRLFDADRASLLTALTLRAVSEFGIELSQFHNDSTSIAVSGDYRQTTGTTRGGQSILAITFGHSKDHRPDLRQLVWILTVSADGAVPIAYRMADGNTTDDPTHIPTWEGLVALVRAS